MNKNKGKRLNRKGVVIKRKMNREDKIAHHLMMIRIPKSLGLGGPFSPDEVVRCRYFERIQAAAASPFFVIDFRMNSVWQPRVGGATGTASGYLGSVARYASSRVFDTGLTIRVASNEPNISVSFAIVYSDIQPSTVITTYQQALTAFTSTFSYCRGTVGETTGMSIYKSARVKMSPGQVVGDLSMVFDDRDFAAQAGANPNQAVWVSFIAVSESAAINLTNGVFLDYDVELRTLFFSVLPLA